MELYLAEAFELLKDIAVYIGFAAAFVFVVFLLLMGFRNSRDGKGDGLLLVMFLVLIMGGVGYIYIQPTANSTDAGESQ